MKDFITVMNNINVICRDKTVDYVVAPFEIHAPNCYAKILNNGLIIYPNGNITTIINRRPWHKAH